MIPTAVDDINARYEAVLAALKTHATSRVVKDSLYRDITIHTDSDVKQGVLMVVLAAEDGYTNDFGVQAKDGATQLLIVAHLKVDAEREPAAIRVMEGEVAEQVKAFIRAGVPGFSLALESQQFSRQLSHPYGWVVSTLRLLPSRANTY